MFGESSSAIAPMVMPSGRTRMMAIMIHARTRR
jgi:hypothetical protein